MLVYDSRRLILPFRINANNGYGELHQINIFRIFASGELADKWFKPLVSLNRFIFIILTTVTQGV